MTRELSRTSALASRHIALGSGLEDWNGMGTAWSYHTNPESEHDAIREAAGMFDMSPLKKVRVTGPDSTEVMDHLHSRDLTRLTNGQSAYGAVLTTSGTVADDAIAFKNTDSDWLLVHGSGTSMELLAESADGHNVEFRLDDDLHIISLQGPAALNMLDPHTPHDLALMHYFHHISTDLFDQPVSISRTGYSGERGYEIMLDTAAVHDVWDRLAAEGAEPASFAALDKVRVEAALLFYGYDMTHEHYPSEVGLSWAISKNGADYRGKAAALAAIGNERHVLAGIVADHTAALEGGETLKMGDVDIGIVNSPAYSHRLNKSLALTHVAPHASSPGTRLTVVSDEASYDARVEVIPFFDPEKTRTHAS